MRRVVPESLLCAALALLFGASLLRHLGAPLLWNDEGDTAMFATRILEVGYPKVHGPGNVLYEFGAEASVGIDEASDAYIGKTWGDFYFAVPGVRWSMDFWRILRSRQYSSVWCSSAGRAAWGSTGLNGTSRRC